MIRLEFFVLNHYIILHLKWYSKWKCHLLEGCFSYETIFPEVCTYCLFDVRNPDAKHHHREESVLQRSHGGHAALHEGPSLLQHTWALVVSLLIGSSSMVPLLLTGLIWQETQVGKPLRSVSPLSTNHDGRGFQHLSTVPIPGLSSSNHFLQLHTL